MHWLEYMHEEGFVPDPGPPISTMGRLCVMYRKGDEAYGWGLLEEGHPPSLLTWPRIRIEEMREGNIVTRYSPRQKHVDRLLQHHGPAVIREGIRTGRIFHTEP